LHHLTFIPPSTKVPIGWAERGFGGVPPFKGRNMIGLTLYGCGFGKPHCREYVQSLLKEPLVIGQKYYVDFWVKPLSKSIRCNNMGAFFSVFDIKKDFDVRLKCKPQISSKEIISPKSGEWVHLEAIFTAQTAGKYIVLGNFYSDSLTKIQEPIGKDPLNYAYYYFDEISVYKIPPFLDTPSETGTFEACCIKRGDTILLRNIYFDFDKSSLRSESNIELNKLLRVLGEHQNMKLHITGHTDIVGRSNYNIWLSRNRANAVRTFLIENGIDEDRLKVVAMSYTKPAATNKTDSGRQLNRRVELVVVDE
jgi:OOP family OmpA-OmpF porin